MIFTPVFINLQSLKLNSADNASIVNFGSNFQIDLYVSYKRNQGYGEQNGDYSPIISPFSSAGDSDFVDSPSVKNSTI